MRLFRYIVPGLVIQAVLVGGGYATGRELVEFFFPGAPANALPAMALTAVLFSLGSMICFELARQHQAFDYRSFCKIIMGRFWFLFEIAYFAILLLVLSVVSAAAGDLLQQMAGTAPLVNSAVFMGVVAFLVFFGNRLIERVISIWSGIFYITYGTMCVLVIIKFGPALHAALTSAPVNYLEAARDGISYTGYNIAILPILLFVARDFQSRKEAWIAGALAGPLILLPGFAFLLVLCAFHPDILSAPLPVTVVLDRLGNPVLAACIRVVILGAFLKTGVGLLHGLNERYARALSDRGAAMPRFVRPLVAFAAMVFSVYVATAVGIIDLIGSGYRYSSYVFMAIFVLPLLTRGIWLMFKSHARPAATTS